MAERIKLELTFETDHLAISKEELADALQEVENQVRLGFTYGIYNTYEWKMTYPDDAPDTLRDKIIEDVLALWKSRRMRH